MMEKFLFGLEPGRLRQCGGRLKTQADRKSDGSVGSTEAYGENLVFRTTQSTGEMPDVDGVGLRRTRVTNARPCSACHLPAHVRRSSSTIVCHLILGTAE